MSDSFMNTEMIQAFQCLLLFAFYINCNIQCDYFSLYLYKLGVAPQIQDLLGKVAFTGSCLLK